MSAAARTEPDTAGARLASARERQGLSLDQVADHGLTRAGKLRSEEGEVLNEAADDDDGGMHGEIGSTEDAAQCVAQHFERKGFLEEPGDATMLKPVHRVVFAHAAEEHDAEGGHQFF